jgi:hypothetical protein
MSADKLLDLCKAVVDDVARLAPLALGLLAAQAPASAGAAAYPQPSTISMIERAISVPVTTSAGGHERARTVSTPHA